MRSASARWTCKTCSSARLPNPSRSRFPHRCRDPSAVRLRRLPRRHSRLTRRLPHPDLRERLNTATFTIVGDSRHPPCAQRSSRTRGDRPENHAVHEDFGAVAAVVRVAEAEGVGELVQSRLLRYMRSRALRNERQRDLERGRLSTYRVSRVQGVWASARPAASDASSVRSMRLVLLGGSPMRWANTLAPSAESRRAFGTGPDDCVSSGAGACGSAERTLASRRKR
jgi:hypothetical protein